MVRKMKRRLAAGAGAALAVAGGGAAIAATQLSPKAESEAVVNDAAKQLGVTPAKLSDALKQALANRVDAAVAAGTIDEGAGRPAEGADRLRRLPALRRPRPRLRPRPRRPARRLRRAPLRGGDLPRRHRGGAADEPRGRQDPRRRREGAGQVRLRAGRRARGGRDEGARRRGRGREADEGPTRRARHQRKAAVPGPRRRQGTRPAAPSAGTTASASAAARPAPTPAIASMGSALRRLRRPSERTMPARAARTSFDAMGVEIVVGGAGQAEVDSIRSLYEEWDRVFSRFRSESELSAVNRSTERILEVSPLFAQACEIALQAAKATGGLVDPTLGEAVEAAGYDRDFAELDDSSAVCRLATARPLERAEARRPNALPAAGAATRPERSGQGARRGRSSSSSCTVTASSPPAGTSPSAAVRSSSFQGAVRCCSAPAESRRAARPRAAGLAAASSSIT